MSSVLPLVVPSAEAERLLQRIDVQDALRRMFLDLAAGDAVQPAQQLVEFPGGGDFINYLGVLAREQVYGVKTSPYLPRPDGAVVTAWTLLMSMTSGQPLMLCDAAALTTERTAATTAVAVDALAPAGVTQLAVIGSGAVARAHIRHCLALRPWQRVRVHSPRLLPGSERADALRALDPRVEVCATQDAALADAEVILLCTSSAAPVLDPRQLGRATLVTSISTNAPRAHEVPPQALAEMDVYCDYRATTPGSAGEMRIAAEQHGWKVDALRGDLPELLADRAPRPDYRRPVFFRSIGLGLEDVALANALYHLKCEESA
ncbi:ornithine cyclodeaminase family protein [Pseudomonas tohonis]|uniref:ornithine cyclodeaminase family protein n=1 Tax=Pseudomonas tohonis TaxID=2725477 RepID=UPI00255BA176|nr:ornithine cyclodeaminase family protein [Pseudomonas tohonis]